MITPPDAPVIVDGPPPCSAPASFTSVMNLELFYNPDSQNMVTGNQEVWRTIGTMDVELTQDWLWIELFEGPPPDYTTENFPAAPFTIDLTGGRPNRRRSLTAARSANRWPPVPTHRSHVRRIRVSRTRRRRARARET
jgi:hypothetical protein